MLEDKERQTLVGLVTPATKRDECVKIIGQLLTPEEIKSLGGEEVASEKVVDSMAYLGVFAPAPAPATFNKGAFLFTAVADLPEEEGETIWNICKQIGVLKDGSGRVSISTDLVEMLGNTENGYLTEE